MRPLWLCLIPVALSFGTIFSATYFSHTVVLPWGLGELGYVGAAALASIPAVTALVAIVISALAPRGLSLGWLIFLSAPGLYMVMAAGTGAELAWPSSKEESSALLLPVVVTMPLVTAPWLLHLVLRAEFRERAGVAPAEAYS